MPKKGKGRGRGRGRDAPEKVTSEKPGKVSELTTSCGKQDPQHSIEKSDKSKGSDKSSPPTKPVPKQQDVPTTEVSSRQLAATDSPVQSGGARPKERQAASHGHVSMPSPQEMKKTSAGPAASSFTSQQQKSQQHAKQKSDQEARHPPTIVGDSSHQLVPVVRSTPGFTIPKRRGYGNLGRPIELYSNHFKVKFPDITIFQYDMSTQPDSESHSRSSEWSCFTIPKRRGYGNLGRPIELYSNHFKVKFPDITIFQYDMSTQPEKLPKKKLRDVFEQMQTSNKHIFSKRCVFDGRKGVYSPAELKFSGNQIELNVEVCYEEGNNLKVKVTLKQVSTINLHQLKQYLDGKLNITPYVAMQAFDIILRHGPSMRFTPVGRSLFCEPGRDDNFDIGGGLELHKGFYQSMRPSSWKEFKMAVNIDVSNTSFYKPGPVLDFMAEVLQMRSDSVGRPLKDSDRKKFEKSIKGLQIEVRREPKYKRKFRVIGVTQKEAERLTFPFTDDKGKTYDYIVAKYFFDKYKIQLRYSRLPCLHVGQPEKKTYIPIEMCYIVPNQHCRKKLSPQQTSDMIKKTAIPAPERLAEIQRWVKTAAHHEDPHLKSFGISIDPNLMKIPGRVLQPPSIKYKEEKPEQPREGSWSMQGKKFCNAVSVNVWGIICFENQRFCSDQDLEKMHFELTRVSAKIGMHFQNASFVKYVNPNNEPCLKTLFESYCKNYKGLQLLFIVLPGKGNDIYGDIKKAGDSQVGIATQNIQAKNAKKANPRTMENICLKINAKLGGINNVISNISPIMKTPVLILGADVTHPSPGDFHRPSIAAVVGSQDQYAFKYNAKVKVQAHRQEIIEDLEIMVKELLVNFRSRTNAIPAKIIMYRDGVSEGQFQQVLDSELQAIRRACSSLSKTYKPGITFLTVQKRHHTRLFCVNKREEQGKSRNVPAGTIVDKDITHPVNWDFFLCSHAGIQGTSRPAHYYVLWDDNDFTQTQLEEFTNQMCYTYARCTRSTSIPSPAYYAHHAAFRARDILNSDLKGSDSGSSVASSDAPKLATEDLKKMNDTVQIHFDQSGRMYYA